MKNSKSVYNATGKDDNSSKLNTVQLLLVKMFANVCTSIHLLLFTLSSIFDFI